ncbi:hypothetical protein QTP88_013548 [Uroleucon formosanum]
MYVVSLFVWAAVLVVLRFSDAALIPLQFRDRTAASISDDHSITVLNELVNRRMVKPWTNRWSSTPPSAASSSSLSIAATYHVTMVPVRRTGQEYCSSKRPPCTGSGLTSSPPIFIFHITLQAPSSWSVQKNPTPSTCTPSICMPQCIPNDNGNFRIVIEDMWPNDECPPAATNCRPTTTTCRPTTTTCQPTTATCRPTTTTCRSTTTTCRPTTTICRPTTTTCRPFTCTTYRPRTTTCRPTTTTCRSTTTICGPTTMTCRPTTTTCRPTTTTCRPTTMTCRHYPFTYTTCRLRTTICRLTTTTFHTSPKTCRPSVMICRPTITTNQPSTYSSKNQFFKCTLSMQCSCRTYANLHGQPNGNLLSNRISNN